MTRRENEMTLPRPKGAARASGSSTFLWHLSQKKKRKKPSWESHMKGPISERFWDVTFTVKFDCSCGVSNGPTKIQTYTRPVAEFQIRQYRGANKGLHVLLSRTKAGPGRTVKQEQEEISRNHVQTFICHSVCGGPSHSHPMKQTIILNLFVNLHAPPFLPSFPFNHVVRPTAAVWMEMPCLLYGRATIYKLRNLGYQLGEFCVIIPSHWPA